MNTRVLLLLGLLVRGPGGRAETPGAANPPVQKTARPDAAVSYAPVQAALEKSGGVLSRQVRAAYLDWAEQTVQKEADDEGKAVPAVCMLEVNKDETLKDAMFGAVDPPDPSILENYARLRAALGPQFMQKYRQLVIAEAVATRSNGATASPETATMVEPADPAETADLADADDAPPEAPEPLVAGIARFMRQGGVSALELFQNESDRDKLTAFLRSDKLEAIDARQIGQVANANSIFPLLKKAMIELGQRPANREAMPDQVAWLRYLAWVYESKLTSPATTKAGTEQQWPRFPMDRAPWPLLMPMHRMYPLGEARYIWEKYEGLHGPERYHTYGPYRGGVGKLTMELRPSEWHWNAWPDVIVHGGVCTTMAPMSVETHITLCEPAVMAAQPHHSNLMSFRNAGGYWFTVIEQAFAGGPNVTHGTWLFNDRETSPGMEMRNGKKSATADYHMGLAQAMNVGLARYMDTRIAVNLYHHLPEAEVNTLGRRLLVQAAQTNPYNASVWHLLGKQMANIGEGIALVKMTMGEARTAGTQNGGTVSATPVQAPAALPKQVKGAMTAYWNTIEGKLATEAVLSHPVPADKTAAAAVYDFLKTVPGASDTKDMAYLMDTQGPEGEETRLENTVERHVAGEIGNKKGPAKRFGAELNAFVASAGAEAGGSLIERLKSEFPEGSSADDSYLATVTAAGRKLNHIRAANKPGGNVN